jgi:hypothetical protein
MMETAPATAERSSFREESRRYLLIRGEGDFRITA